MVNLKVVCYKNLINYSQFFMLTLINKDKKYIFFIFKRHYVLKTLSELYVNKVINYPFRLLHFSVNHQIILNFFYDENCIYKIL